MSDKKLNSQPLTISFSNSKSNGQVYRGISDSNSSSSISLQTVDSIHQPINIKSQSLNEIDMYSIPKSKAPSKSQPQSLQKVQFKGLLQPLDILTTSIANESEINDFSISCQSPPPLVSNQYCNELNSYLMENINCQQVMKNLNNILNRKFKEIDFQIDYNNKQISGLIFMQSYVVYFMIYIWNENNNNTIIEFRRTNGDALASAKFWSQIKGYLSNETEQKMEPFDLIELNFDLPQLEMQNNNNNNTHLDEMQLNSLIESLNKNDLFVVDELNFLYESIMENQQICNDILSNKYLMKQLINESLLNKDICVSRIVLLILNQLAKVTNNNIIGQDYKLFNNINLLLNHKRMLIKTYTIGLLSTLSMIKTNWNINQFERKEMIQNIKKYENECTNNLHHHMIQKINQKLMMN